MTPAQKATPRGRGPQARRLLSGQAVTTLGLYIDPGVRMHAAAFFSGSTLSHLAFVPREAFVGYPVKELSHVVIEKPQVYPGASEKDPNDLIELAVAAGFVDGAIRARGGPPSVFVYPADWKGQIKKPLHHLRVWETLTLDERSAFARDSGQSVGFVAAKIQAACEALAQTGKVKNYSWAAHNLLDAVGLGLWHHTRVGKAGHRYPQS